MKLYSIGCSKPRVVGLSPPWLRHYGERLYGKARTNIERVYGEVHTDAYPVDAGASGGGTTQIDSA